MPAPVDNRFLRAVATMVGSTVGVGIFGLPYALSQGGVAAGSIILLCLGGLVTALQLMYAEIALHTPGRHRLVGYVRSHLGGLWPTFATAALSAALWGSMVAYLIVGGKFLHALLSPWFGGNVMPYALALWGLAVALLLRGIQFISRFGSVTVCLLLFLFAFIVLDALPHAHAANLSGLGHGSLLIPYGVALFALGGMGIIPEMKAVLGPNRESQLPRAVIIAMTVICALYLTFGIVVVSVLGPATTASALDGLAPILGRTFELVSLLLGGVAILSVFTLVGIELTDTFRCDLRRSPRASVALAAGVPLCLYLLGVRQLIDVLTFAGSVFGGMLGILVVATYERMRRNLGHGQHRCLDVPRGVSWAIMLVFASGIILTVITFLS